MFNEFHSHKLRNINAIALLRLSDICGTLH
jgi:hypothetical protein